MMTWATDFCVQRGYLDLEEKDEKGSSGMRRSRRDGEGYSGSQAWNEAIEKGGGEGKYDLRTFG